MELLKRAEPSADLDVFIDITRRRRRRGVRADPVSALRRGGRRRRATWCCIGDAARRSRRSSGAARPGIPSPRAADVPGASISGSGRRACGATGGRCTRTGTNANDAATAAPLGAAAARAPTVAAAARAVPDAQRSPDPPRFTSARGVDAARDATCASTCSRRPDCCRCPSGRRSMPSSSARSRHADYIVAKVYFESLPGFFVTGNLYRPDRRRTVSRRSCRRTATGPTAGSNTRRLNSGPGRAIGLARQGFVVFTHDMVGYNDSRQLPHTFGGRRENLWGLSLGGLQLWNAIRALDFLETLPYVRRDGFGVTGESGGGTQTFLLGAVDDRVAVAAPVNMISLHMQGGCLCENMPGLRIDTNNVEIAATIAPRPMLMVSATGDWTKETLEREFPAMRSAYALFGAESKVHAVRFTRSTTTTRTAARRCMRGWRGGCRTRPRTCAARSVPSRPTRSPTCSCSTAARCRSAALTAGAVHRAVDRGRAGAARGDAEPAVLQSALRHALGFRRASLQSAVRARQRAQAGDAHRRRRGVAARRRRRAERRAASTCGRSRSRRSTPRRPRRSGTSRPTTAPPPASASPTSSRRCAQRHRRCSSRTATPRLPALLAAAIAPVRAVDRRRRRLRHLERRRSSSSAVYIPGLRRAGDFQTAAGMVRGEVIVHDARDRFQATGIRVERDPLTAKQIVAAAAKSAS